MAENKKVYTIQINGIEQSIKQVDALSDALQFLDTKIKELESRSVSVASASPSGGGNRTAELNTEDKLLKQIRNTEEQIANARREDYQSLLAQKDLLKNITDEAKERAAAERLSSGSYGNNMKGLKQELSDIKTVMQTTDLGDEKFQQLTERANELTNKLKELEQAYGQFGRNVGRYPGTMGEGFSKLQIEVNGTTKEFDNAKQALVELRKEMQTLSVKQDLGVISEEEAARLQELIPTFKQLESSVKDAGKPMDALMDVMEGIVAIASTAEGIGALFGFDDDEIQKSIQKLVALQNALQGIQTLQEQMQKAEGIGKWLSKGDAAIDGFTKKLFGLDKAAKTTSATVASTGTAGKTAATGLGAATVAAGTATKSFTLATAAATALRVVLSALGIGLVIGAISLLVDGITSLISKQSEAKKYQEDLNKAVESGQKAYADAQGELIKYQVKLDNFNGSKKEEKKLVEELNSKYGGSLGTYKTLAEWKKVLKERGEVLCQVMLKEAEAQALLNMYTEAYIKLQDAKKNAAEGGDEWAEWLPWNWGGKSAQEKADDGVKEIENQMEDLKQRVTELYKDIEKTNQGNNLFDYAPQIEKGTSSTKAAAKKAEEEISKLKLELMDDGLAKTIFKLRQERAARIKAAKETGIDINLVDRVYDKKELEAKKEWAYRIGQVYANMWKNIYDLNHKNAQMDFEDQMAQMRLEYKKLQDEAARNSGTALGDYSDQGMIVTDNYEVLVEKDADYTNRLREEFNTRTEDRKRYYAETERLTIEELNKQLEIENSVASESLNAELRNLNNSYSAQDHALEEHLKKGEITKAQYDEVSLRLEEERRTQEANIQRKYNTESQQRERDAQEKKEKAIIDSNNNILENYQDIINKLSEIDTSSIVQNGFGFTNVSDTISRNKAVLSSYKQTYDAIRAEIQRLQSMFDSVNTSTARQELKQLIDQYKQLLKQIGQSMTAVTKDSKNVIPELISDINTYVQGFGQAINGIFNAVWDVQDSYYQKQVEEIDKSLEMARNKYSEMDSLAQEHASTMQSLEADIANAQGDARDHLIARYNAEMEAQKEALKEKKKAEKEEEKLQAKKDKLDKEQREKQRGRDLIQAAINAAMSISMAAVNKWPVPAIPMMAAAAVAGAAQVAAIASKHYAQGGVLPNKGYGVAQGNLHRDGGIKVLGGRAEIEGGEYVTNRVTTSKNVDLLEYINTKRRKVNLDDLVEFYGGGKAIRKNISSVRTRFADGGVIPTLRNDINLNDRMMQALEDYSNRPVQVAVVDIIDRTQAVNDVRVMAGLE